MFIPKFEEDEPILPNIFRMGWFKTTNQFWRSGCGWEGDPVSEVTPRFVFFFWWDSLDKNKKSLMVKLKFCQANSVVAFWFINISIYNSMSIFARIIIFAYIIFYKYIYIYRILAWGQACEIHNNPEFLIFPCSNANVAVQESAADSLQRAGGSKMIFPNKRYCWWFRNSKQPSSGWC